MGIKTCACGCGKGIPADAHPLQKYVNEQHRRRMEKRRERRRKQAAADRKIRSDAKPTEDQSVVYKGPDESDDGRGSAREGPGLDLLAGKFPEVWQSFCAKTLSYDELVAAVGDAWPQPPFPGLSAANCSRWAAGQAARDARGYSTETWEREPDVERALSNLADFTRRYFPDQLVPGFHREWEGAINETVDRGGRLLLLAPVRHGKTEMLIRYCLMRIARDPDVKIGWVSQTQKFAERMVRAIRLELENNEKLIRDVLGPGGSFAPPARSALPWTNSELMVSNRKKRGKSATVTAVSVGGTIVGQDFDFIVLDDPQDRDRCGSPTTRVGDIEWFLTDFLSRKMNNTSIVFIMSRQHMDDLPGHILRDHADGWDVRVYKAHDPGCTLPESDTEGHVDCLLWPDAPWLGFDFLMEKKRDRPDNYWRNYQNDPKTDATVFLTAADIDDLKDPQLTAGFFPPGSRLVAGIDPASGKPTAATLWAYTHAGKRMLVDAEMASAGNKGVMEILDAFAQGYGCRKFIIETNGYQGQVMQDTAVRQMANALALHLKPHYTSRINKWDDASGVVAMLHGLRAGDKYLLPGSGEREVMDRLELVYRQWLLFDPDFAGHKHADDDLVMASWFPQTEMDGWDVRQTVEVVSDFDATTYSGTSYGTSVRYAGVR